MYVAAVIVEKLDYDGHLRTLQLWAEPGRPLTIALAEEFDEPASGPFHFLDGHSKQTFDKGFAETKAWKLSQSNFQVMNDEYRFHTSWEGIPTERNTLSYYSISLPKFAIPTEIRFRDPYSEKEYDKEVICDARRNRFVSYLQCRSSIGSFAFLLDVKFRRSNLHDFALATFRDSHTTQHGIRPNPYANVLPPQSLRAVEEFLAQVSRKENEQPKGMNLRDDLETSPNKKRAIFEMYPKLRDQIYQARVAARGKNLDVESIRKRYSILGSTREDLIRKFILDQPLANSAETAAKTIIQEHTDFTFQTVDRYTRKSK